MINKVILVGNLGADPDKRSTNSGKSVANMSVATKNFDGSTEWHKVTVWDKQADNCAKFLKKGSKVYVEGRIQTRSYEKDGDTKYITEIVAQTVQFLDSKGSGPSTNEPPAKPEPAAVNNEDIDEDDLPF